MLNFSGASLRRGARLLFQDATFTIDAGDRVGLTGANGTGKSSLLALVRGDLQTDSGRFSAPPGLALAYVAQETPALDRPALDFVIDGDIDLRATQKALSQAETADDGHRQAELHASLDAVDGYTVEARAARLLDGLGFTPDRIRAPVHAFSGGWRMRLNLAQALMRRSDLLLLDEPTNHLDLDAVIWLGDWLRAYPGTLLLISHDREFLDHVVTEIAHIEHARIALYRGNYSLFERKRAERLAQQQAAHEQQQRKVAHMRAFIDRFRAQATKARAAQSRLKALERMTEVAPAHVDTPFRFEFPDPGRLPYPLLKLRGVHAGYGDDTILNALDCQFAPGDRIGLLGPNGAGKSTLIKLLAGQLAPRLGERIAADRLRIGYFAQHQIEQLHAGDSPLDHLRRMGPKAREQDVRDFLGGFGFVGDAALAPVAPLSGGEKARLVLALLVYDRPNLLLLDEPTNHLDLEMRHALTMALQGFTGALVVVSHDRHLLKSVADAYWMVSDGRVSPFDGDLDDYARWLGERRRGPAQDAADTSGPSRRDQRREAAAARQRVAPLRRECRRLEKRLDTLQAERQALEQALTDPGVYDDDAKDRLKRLLVDKGRIDAEIDTAESAWLEAGERLETAGESP